MWSQKHGPIQGLTGLGLHRCGSVTLIATRGDNTHLLPVVGKLLAAVKTNHVRTSLRVAGTPLSLPVGLREGRALVPATEYCVENRHFSSIQNLGITMPIHSRYLPSELKPEFVSMVSFARENRD